MGMTATEGNEMTEHRMTETEATDEALLMLTRRMRRMFPHQFTGVLASLPEGAVDAIMLAEARADALRDRTPEGRLYPINEIETADAAS